MDITPDIIKEMLKGTKSLAEWARVLGKSVAALSSELFYIGETAKDAGLAARARQALKVIEAVRTVAPAAPVVGAGVTAGISVLARVVIGTSLVLGVIVLLYMGYRIFMAEPDKPQTPVAAGPVSLGDKPSAGPTHRSGPLTGSVESGGDLPSNPARAQEVRDQAKRELIKVPDGEGADEVIKAGGYTAVSAGRVTPALQAAIQRWEKQIDGAMEELYHQGAFDGFGDTWVNLLKWKPYPSVVKAQLKQDGNTVTGFLWLNVGDHPDGFKTKKLAITRGVATGSRGFEDVQIELADGQVRGTLYLVGNGSRIEGELNGCYVSLSGSRTSDARKALEVKFPRPK